MLIMQWRNIGSFLPPSFRRGVYKLKKNKGIDFSSKFMVVFPRVVLKSACCPFLECSFKLKRNCNKWCLTTSWKLSFSMRGRGKEGGRMNKTNTISTVVGRKIEKLAKMIYLSNDDNDPQLWWLHKLQTQWCQS